MYPALKYTFYDKKLEKHEHIYAIISHDNYFSFSELYEHY